MKYFVLEVSVANNQMAQVVTPKDTLNEARMVFHQTRASALANPEVTYNLTQVIEETGKIYLTEYHGQAVINPEPEVEPESEAESETEE